MSNSRSKSIPSHFERHFTVYVLSTLVVVLSIALIITVSVFISKIDDLEVRNEDLNTEVLEIRSRILNPVELQLKYDNLVERLNSNIRLLNLLQGENLKLNKDLAIANDTLENGS